MMVASGNVNNTYNIDSVMVYWFIVLLLVKVLFSS